MTVAAAQAVALAYPCRLALEALHSRFANRIVGATVVLTVNNGHE